jgi:hypothetical protein
LNQGVGIVQTIIWEVASMKRAFSLIGVVAVAFAASGLLFGDDKDTKKDTKVVKQGPLPANYSKLGLNDEQKKKLRDIQGEYGPKIQDLQDQIRELRKKERLAMEDVLTDTQKARLRELLLEKAPADREIKSNPPK